MTTWAPVDWSIESSRRQVWLTALGNEGQTKVFIFRSRRVARVFAKRMLPSFMFCDYDYRPLRSIDIVTIGVSVRPPACAT